MVTAPLERSATRNMHLIHENYKCVVGRELFYFCIRNICRNLMLTIHYLTFSRGSLYLLIARYLNLVLNLILGSTFVIFVFRTTMLVYSATCIISWLRFKSYGCFATVAGWSRGDGHRLSSWWKSNLLLGEDSIALRHTCWALSKCKPVGVPSPFYSAN